MINAFTENQETDRWPLTSPSPYITKQLAGWLTCCDRFLATPWFWCPQKPAVHCCWGMDISRAVLQFCERQKKDRVDEKYSNMLCGPPLIKVIIGIPAWNFILVCVCAFNRAFALATFVVLNNSTAASLISCPMLFNACRYLWNHGGLGERRGSWRRWRMTLTRLFSIFTAPLFWNDRDREGLRAGVGES